MAYLDSRASPHRLATIGTVAALHGAAIYALVTGLAVTYVDQVTTILKAYNTPADKPEPLPVPPPPQKPETQQQDNRLIPDQRVITVPTGNAPAAPLGTGEVENRIVTPPLPPLPPLGPSFTARGAKPSNAMGLWATTNDYPARDLREGNQGSVRFTLTVGADGKVQDCTVTGSSGFPGLDAATCKYVSRRARFDPAIDTSGGNVPSIFSSTIRWVIPD